MHSGREAHHVTGYIFRMLWFNHYSAGSPSFCEEDEAFFSLALTNPKEADRSEFSLLPVSYHCS